MSGRTVLETERLTLREFTLDDAAAFMALNNDPEVTRYTHDKSYPDVEAARLGLAARPLADYAARGYGRWACVPRGGGEAIGFCGLKWREELGEVDLGYRFLPAYWGRGLATEAARAVVAYGFGTLGLKRIVGLVLSANVASAAVLRKVGMARDGSAPCGGVCAERWVIESASA